MCVVGSLSVGSYNSQKVQDSRLPDPVAQHVGSLSQHNIGYHKAPDIDFGNLQRFSTVLVVWTIDCKQETTID